MGDSVCSPATTSLHPRGFDDDVVPHLDAGYRLARWLMRNQDDAEDVVQEASLRALRYYQSFAGGNGRAWFLRIVRNTCWGWRDQRRRAYDDPFDEEHHADIRPASDPESLLLRTDGAASIARALSTLPDRLRTLLVLREFEGLSYEELAAAEGIPVGTVMSRLFRARAALRGALERERVRGGQAADRRLDPPQPADARVGLLHPDMVGTVIVAEPATAHHAPQREFPPCSRD